MSFLRRNRRMEHCAQARRMVRKKPAWTGSCPCQPFSSGGKRKGVADERHLWPSFKWLIAQCQPSVVFGEQVASKDGRNWLAGVLFDLEEVGYCATGSDLCAAGVGAPHPRQRLYWAASSNTNGMRWERLRPEARGSWTVEQFARLVQHCSRVAIPSGKYSLLADGIQSRSPILRGYGNAIVPQVASEFIQAFVEAKQMI